MKKISVFSVFLLFVAYGSFCQQFKSPAEEKSLVYFVRFQGALALIDFKYFDGQKYLGRVSGDNYFIYECDPGEHVFWVAAENREYMKGDLKANCTYVIEVRPYMRAVMSGVKLYQISPGDEKALRKIIDLIEISEPAVMKGETEDLQSFIENGMERYKKVEGEVTELSPDWTFKY